MPIRYANLEGLQESVWDHLKNDALLCLNDGLLLHS